MSNTRVVTDGIVDLAVTTAKIAAGAVSGAKIAIASEARGDIMYRNASTWARLAKGSAGQALGSDGTDPVWTNYPRMYTSAEQTITYDTVLAVTHGLGVKPDMVQVLAICKTTEYGWAVGETLTIAGLGGSSDFGVVARVDATDIELTTGVGIRMIDQTTFNQVTLTAANWKYIVKALY